jgi:hypothetical protein
MSNTEDRSARPLAIGGREPAESDLTEIRDSLRGLRFGAVEIIVQDGVIVQINRTEKRRLAAHHSKH